MTKLDEKLSELRAHVEQADLRDLPSGSITSLVLIDVQLRTVDALERLVTLLENKSDPHRGIEG